MKAMKQTPENLIATFLAFVYSYIAIGSYLVHNIKLPERRRVAVIGSQPITRIVASLLSRDYDVTLFCRPDYESAQEYMFEGLEQTLIMEKGLHKSYIVDKHDEEDLQRLADYLEMNVEDLTNLQSEILKPSDRFSSIDMNRYPLNHVKIRKDFQGCMRDTAGKLMILHRKLEFFNTIIFAGHDDFSLITRFLGKGTVIPAYTIDDETPTFSDLMHVEGGTLKVLPDMNKKEVLCLTGNSTSWRQLKVHDDVFVLDQLTILRSVEPMLDLVLIGHRFPLLLKTEIDSNNVFTENVQSNDNS